MSEQEQIVAFEASLKQVIRRYMSEFNLTLASAIGTLESVKLELWLDQKNQPPPDESS